jgi:hypothetical protein
MVNLPINDAEKNIDQSGDVKNDCNTATTFMLQIDV